MNYVEICSEINEYCINGVFFIIILESYAGKILGGIKYDIYG